LESRFCDVATPVSKNEGIKKGIYIKQKERSSCTGLTQARKSRYMTREMRHGALIAYTKLINKNIEGTSEEKI